ncbi:mannan-binding lectin serine protease 1 isoform X1 [Myxocyprinus asiaticus]|uniref:mannan-binding lectin serine protease 1 isoform X1 n=1 Tax=Myxocyprinus asiaticus TaxID=70543 RepID=UPI002221603C|nr:mannan-binding lectin serine protease 1 isoform X1 [Myxocyprinus asiaticus]
MELTRVIVILAQFVWPLWTRVIHLTDMYGTIQSPNFPESYPKETEIQWNITVPDGYQIRLYFMHFDIEPSYLCEYDYLKVYSDTEELAVFCGRENTDTEHVPADDVIMSPGSALSVAFHSDFSNEERYFGFEAHFSAVDVDECRDRNDEDLVCDHFCHNYIGGFYCSCRYGFLLHSDNRTCKVECNESVYSERSGEFTSADFPKPYPKSSDCMYRIELDEGFQVTLEFDDTFDIEDHPDVACPYDFVKILAGDKEFGPFCGDQSPGKIKTGSNMVNILFHSDNSGENLGWKLTYTSTGTECSPPSAPLNGQLEPLQSNYIFKDHITVTCDPGYSLRKDDKEFEHYQIECQNNGKWSSHIPPCKMVDCGPVDLVLGEVVFENSRNSTVFGSRMQYSCKYTPKINNTYTCHQSGQWVSEDGTPLPTCLPVGDYESNLRNPDPQLPTPLTSTPLACGEQSQLFPAQQKRIVGGKTASPGLFPWQVLLSVEDASRVPEDRWFGSGALLSPSWVLTAAHVLRSHRRNLSVVPVAPEHIRVHLGFTDVRDKHTATNHSVEKVILHPQFDPQNYNNDIALVKLSQAVVLSELVRPVCLPRPGKEGHELKPNTLGVVAGWGINTANTSSSTSGLTSDSGAVSDLLQYVKLPVVPQDECKASYASRSINYNITSNMFCAGFYEGGRDTCLGDSGGAFVIQDDHSGRWVAQGLVSWGGPEECGSQRVYGVYTRVANYVRWLHTHMDIDRWW